MEYLLFEVLLLITHTTLRNMIASLVDILQSHSQTQEQVTPSMPFESWPTLPLPPTMDWRGWYEMRRAYPSSRESMAWMVHTWNWFRVRRHRFQNSSLPRLIVVDILRSLILRSIYCLHEHSFDGVLLGNVAYIPLRRPPPSLGLHLSSKVNQWITNRMLSNAWYIWFVIHWTISLHGFIMRGTNLRDWRMRSGSCNIQTINVDFGYVRLCFWSLFVSFLFMSLTPSDSSVVYRFPWIQQKWCRSLDDDSNALAESPWLDKDIVAAFDGVPCRAEFFRYIQWHNHAFTVTQLDLGVPSMVLHYEDYSTRYADVTKQLMEFLELKPVAVAADLPEFIPHKVYGHYYYSKEQTRAIATLVKEYSMKTTWQYLARYFDESEENVLQVS